MTIVIRAARLFDGTGAPSTTDATVVVDGATITAVGGPAPAGATVVDLPGATLLPGLVDTHVHLTFDASPDPVAALATRDADATRAAIFAAARTAARAGITTVRDLGDLGYLSLAVRDAARTDPTLPHILAAGVPVTTPGGHCHFLGPDGCASGVEGVRAAVRDRHARGVDVIKVMASGGQMTPGSRFDRSQYGPDELRALVDEAHRLGLPVAAHAHATPAVADAVAAGVDSVEHASFMTAESVDPVPDDLLEAIVAGGVTISLTLGLRPVAGFAPPHGVLERMPLMMANGARLCAAGARVVVGSDAGIAPIKPHDVLNTSPAQLAMLGMTPAEALHAVTGRAAATLGLGARKGRIAPGFDADLLAVDGDPLTDPAALERVRAVYRGGTAIVG